MTAADPMEIDRNVPQPSRRAGRPDRYPFRYLEPGESFATTETRERVSAAAHLFARRRNAEIDAGERQGPRWQFIVRAQPDGKVRVWRAKDDDQEPDDATA